MSLSQLELFKEAIASIESRGWSNPYLAVGPRTKYGHGRGKYQMMDAFYPQWFAEAGYAGADWRNPQAQEAAASVRMTKLYNKYGRWDLVALAWFAGEGTANQALRSGRIPGGSDGYTSRNEYVRRVMSYMQQHAGRAGGARDSWAKPSTGAGWQDIKGGFRVRRNLLRGWFERSVQNVGDQMAPAEEDVQDDEEAYWSRFWRTALERMSAQVAGASYDPAELEARDKVMRGVEPLGLGSVGMDMPPKITDQGTDVIRALYERYAHQGAVDYQIEADGINVSYVPGRGGGSLSGRVWGDFNKGVLWEVGRNVWGGRYGNGRIPTSELVQIAPGSFLHPEAAAAWNAMVAAMRREGITPQVSGAYRSYQSQVATKKSKGYLAATPGRSIHGWGLAIDVGGNAARKWIQRNGHRFGWVHPAWARPGGSKPEPWHFEYIGGFRG